MLGDQPLFIAGMPRAASMWTYNVTRRLIRAAGMRPVPEKIPLDETRIIQQALSGRAGAGAVYCVKTHVALPMDRPDIRIICNIRDIRDATLSFMRFTRCSFDAALESARDAMRITDHYFGKGSLNVLPVDYDDILAEPVAVAGRIAAFIGAEVAAREVEAIVQALSRERVQASLRKLAPGAESAGRAAPQIRNMDGSYRLCDAETGFQSNHITSRGSGEWKEAFTPEQRQRLNALLGDWLQRYGYAPGEA